MKPNTKAMQRGIQSAITQLEGRFLEREELIRLLFLAVMSGENALLVGPPGTAKSQLARAFSQLFGTNHWFEYLLTRFSTPDELFGPISIQQLKQDQYVRKTKGYIPTAQFAFLDEIFKANSAILNALLSILNERVFFNGQEKEEVPLLFVMAASNELPDDQEQLAALYDRFLIRYEVGYLKLASSYEKMFQLDFESLPTLFNMYEVKDVQEAASKVHIPESLVYFLYRLKQQMEDKEFVISDRRLRKIALVWQTSAVLNGRDEVSLWDTVFTPHMLWDVPEDLPVLTELYQERFMESLKIELEKELPLRYYEQISSKWMEKEDELHAFQFKKEIGSKMTKEASEQAKRMLEQCRIELEETGRHLQQKLTDWLKQEADLPGYLLEKNFMLLHVESYTVKFAHLRLEGERHLQILQGLYRTLFDRELPGVEYDYTL
ncbi:AAA family ATPase [Brevibacillus laterosporus]|uniref:AAA family ATPase n=1 Tax=Brevibacillus laterosporus TaxID=1465 RepID=UPI0035A5C694